MLSDALIRFFTSLRLTVALLVLGLVLVFWGTMAQVHLGLYQVQNEFFRSFVVYWHPKNFSFKIPVFPGGYLLGGLLLINLFAAHFRYYKSSKKKIGIIMVHLGVVLLLAGQFLTDLLSTESSMHIRTGSSSNYSESTGDFELAITDASAKESDKVVTIPSRRLLAHRELRHDELPFAIRVNTFYANSEIADKAGPGLTEAKTTGGSGPNFWWRNVPRETEMQKRDMPSGILELLAPQGSLGTFLISGFLARPQQFDFSGHHYELSLRPRRFYKPFSLQLVEFKFDRYPGTDIPKNFSSRIRLQNPANGDDRETLIYMNNPLRYAGETFYQADWDHDDEKGTVLQVVHNPSWLTPYLACALVGGGLIVQFLTHLIGFALKRRTA